MKSLSHFSLKKLLVVLSILSLSAFSVTPALCEENAPQPLKFSAEIQRALGFITSAIKEIEDFENENINEQKLIKNVTAWNEKAKEQMKIADQKEKNKYKKMFYRDTLVRLEWVEHSLKNAAKKRAHMMGYLNEAMIKLVLSATIKEPLTTNKK